MKRAASGCGWLAMACVFASVEASGQTAAPTRPPQSTRVEEDYRAPAEGRVRVEFSATREAQEVMVYRRALAGSTLPDGRERFATGSGVCRTPCSLFVPPGELSLRAHGRSLRGTETVLRVPETGARYEVRSASSALYNLGIGFVSIGSVVVLATTVVALADQTGLTNQDRPALSTDAVLGIGGLVVALFAAGIPLMATQRTGVSQLRSLAPLTPYRF